MAWVPLDGEALEAQMFMGVTLRLRNGASGAEVVVNFAEVHAAQMCSGCVSMRLGADEWVHVQQPEYFDYQLDQDEARAAAIVAGLITDINAYRRDKNALTRDDAEPFGEDGE